MRTDALAALRYRGGGLAEGRAKQQVCQVKPRDEGAHGLNEPGIAVDIKGDALGRLENVVDRQGSMPIKPLPDQGQMRTDQRTASAFLKGGPAAGSPDKLTIRMKADKAAAAEHGLG